MDVHIRRSITSGLRHRGVDVLTAQEDGTGRLPDPALLDRAMAVGRVVFTHDKDFLREASRRQQSGDPFAGVVFADMRAVAIGQCINDLELIAQVYEPVDIANRVEFLPL